MTSPEPSESAQHAGLRYVRDTDPGILRKCSARGFTYRGADGTAVRARAVIRPLALHSVTHRVLLDRSLTGKRKDARREAAWLLTFLKRCVGVDSREPERRRGHASAG